MNIPPGARLCINCNEWISFPRHFSPENCAKADQLLGLAHVFALHSNGRGVQDFPEPVDGVCLECEEYRPDDARVQAKMKCGFCAYGTDSTA